MRTDVDVARCMRKADCVRKMPLVVAGRDVEGAMGCTVCLDDKDLFKCKDRVDSVLTVFLYTRGVK